MKLKSYMIDIYVKMVKRGIRKIEDIPEAYQSVVADTIVEMEERTQRD